MFDSDKEQLKWASVLDNPNAPAIKDDYRRAVTAVLLENQNNDNKTSAAHRNFTLSEDVSTVANSSAGWDPILISLVRRNTPNNIGFDIAGVQPMKMPTGTIFALRAKYIAGRDGLTGTDSVDPDGAGAATGSTTGKFVTADEAFMDAPKGMAQVADEDDFLNVENTAAGWAGNNEPSFGGAVKTMGFQLDKATATAKNKSLQAEYTLELAQDLKSVHGLDAESELANILSAEILAEQNREIINIVNGRAKVATGILGGKYDVALSDGRYMNEKFKTLLFQIETQCNGIAKDTRRGKGNYIICSSNVASALAATGVLDYTPALATTLSVDDTGNTFAGVLNGRIKVFIDPYAAVDYITVGYRGTNQHDAGLFYCPYIPLTLVKGVDSDTLEPKFGFKTRYAVVENPWVEIANQAALAAATATKPFKAVANPYFRKFVVKNLQNSAD